MKILIIGAGGFVGPHLLRHLAAEGRHRLYATVCTQETTELPEAEAVFHLDLPDADRITALLEQIQPEGVIHLAAQSSVAYAWKAPAQTVDVNVKGTLELLEAMRKLSHPPRLLFVGSSEAYGIPRSSLFGITEDEPTAPVNPYAVTKLCAEQLALLYHRAYGLDVVVARPFNHIGAGQSDRFAIADFCKQTAGIECGLQEPVIHVGDLTVRRDFTDVRDIVRAYGLLLEQGRPGAVYNIGSGKATALSAVLEQLRAMSRTPYTVKHEESRRRPAEIPVMRANIQRLQQDTGWAPNITLETALADVLQYWRNTIRQEQQQGGVS